MLPLRALLSGLSVTSRPLLAAGGSGADEPEATAVEGDEGEVDSKCRPSEPKITVR